jgi:phosphoribosylformimino-5-aminoimidazole carboxamide ribotide isomerase
MKILPAIDIKNGKCVRLFQGNYAKETIYEDDPIIVAKKWMEQGAQILHLVDLDGARVGKAVNLDCIKKIINSISIPVQVGGGVRSLKTIDELFNIGVSRIILGTVALEDEKLLSKAVKLYEEKIIISLDTKNGILMKNGWIEKTKKELLPTIQKLENIGVQSIIFTDTVRDGTLTEPNYEVIKSLKENTKMNLIVAGGISSREQIKKLKKMNVDGVIIGKALYEGKISVKEALLC